MRKTIKRTGVSWTLMLVTTGSMDNTGVIQAMNKMAHSPVSQRFLYPSQPIHAIGRAKRVKSYVCVWGEKSKIPSIKTEDLIGSDNLLYQTHTIIIDTAHIAVPWRMFAIEVVSPARRELENTDTMCPQFWI